MRPLPADVAALVRAGHLEEAEPGVYRRPRTASPSPSPSTPVTPDHPRSDMPNFDNPTNRTTQQRLNRAVPFQESEKMDHLVKMRDEHPEEFAKLPPRVHIGVGLYEADRQRHATTTGGAA